jgi:hypothetical protein
VRIIRKIAQVEMRLKTIEEEMDQFRQGELFKLKQQVVEARKDGRDLLKELSQTIDGEIDQARQDLQMSRKTPRHERTRRSK